MLNGNGNGKSNRRSFGQVVGEQRRALGLSRQDVARRIRTSRAYVGYLESGKRNPSDEMIMKLASVLGLDRTELYFLARPDARHLLGETRRNGGSVWEQFQADERLRHLYDIGPDEMEMLSRVAMLGQIRGVRDFVFILNSVRQALLR